MKHALAFATRPLAAASLALVSALVAAPAHAVTYTLVAETTALSMPDGTTGVPMWGYRVCAGTITAAACSTPAAPITSPGAALVVPPGDSSLSVTLHNRLSAGVFTSFVVHGLNTTMTPVFTNNAGATCTPGAGADDAIRRECRLRSFTHEAPFNGAATYNYNNVRPGTYLYQSGTLPQIQVQMGLYGMMSRDAGTAGTVYPGVTYANQTRVIFSEVDPVVHAAVNSGTFTSSTLDYNPKHFRTHVYDALSNLPVQVGAGALPQYLGAIPTTHLIRMANAGLQTRVPTLNDGTWALLGEDAQPYPYAREQYTALLPAAKTTEAWLNVPAARELTMFDRRMAFADAGSGVAGQFMKFSTTPVLTTLLAHTCANTGAQGVLYTCTVSSTTPGATLSFTGPAGMTMIPGPGAGTSTINWTPTNAQAQKPSTPTLTHPVTVSASTLAYGTTSSSFSVAVANVNDAPIAVANSYAAAAGSLTLTVPVATGVLANDSDPDGDPMSASVTVPVSGTGTLGFNSNGSFTFTLPAGTVLPTSRSFTYVATDTPSPGPALPSNAVVVTMNFAPAAAVLQANADAYAFTNTVLLPTQTFTVLTNDTSNTTPAFQLNSILVSRTGLDAGTGGALAATATRGGITTPNTGGNAGTIQYQAPNNVSGTVPFSGTDFFFYRVNNNSGTQSNWARVDVAMTGNLLPARTATSTTFGALLSPNVVQFTGTVSTYSTPNLTSTTYVVDPDGTVNAASMQIAATDTSTLGTVPVAASCYTGPTNLVPLTGYGTFSLSAGAITFTPLRRSNYLGGATNLPIRCAVYYQVSDNLGATMATRALVNVWVRAD